MSNRELDAAQVRFGPEFQLAIEMGTTDAHRLETAIDVALAHALLERGTVRHLAAGELGWTVRLQVAGHMLPGLLEGFYDGQADWLVVSVPVSAVETAFPVHFPEPPPTEEEWSLGVDASRVELDVDQNPWMRRMEAVLADVADSVAATVPFELALIGEEVSGT